MEVGDRVILFLTVPSVDKLGLLFIVFITATTQSNGSGRDNFAGVFGLSSIRLRCGQRLLVTMFTFSKSPMLQKI